MLSQQGKLHFGYVFGYGAIGCTVVYSLINLMHQEGVSFDRTASVLGYSMLPIVMLATIAPVVSLQCVAVSSQRALASLFSLLDLVFDRSTFGSVLSICAIVWSTFNATRFFEHALSMREQVSPLVQHRVLASTQGCRASFCRAAVADCVPAGLAVRFLCDVHCVLKFGRGRGSSIFAKFCQNIACALQSHWALALTAMTRTK